MTSDQIRKTFLEFFKSKGHEIVPSAPIVVKNDPTLMFTNAGMNQFKDLFLGNDNPKFKRVADTQKCLRVSGKHNDLEEVGVDTYHHTMFEMLGNWSFGDYFKQDAIAWAWELLTEIYKLPTDRLYVTVFEGDSKEQLAFDQESYDCWKKLISEDRILHGNKKDNFWEMGETGPCGPCTEIHVDLRSDEERKKTDGKTLVNNDHPQVIEIWNNVFMEFNRKADGSLEHLPAKHVDTGMGFERLCMALQSKKSNYDTDVFQPAINYIAAMSGFEYGKNEKTDIAMRVMSDHIRAIAFSIADGQLPSNNKAGYVIRRILRRAVRYAFTFLKLKDPFLNRLVPLLADQFAAVFPELKKQEDFVQRVIMEEEVSFLRTLETGIKKFEAYKDTLVKGEFAFELYDTYGFPIDLTQLMAREKNMQVDMAGFEKSLDAQKNRSRKAAETDTEDWVILSEGDKTDFTGYDELTTDAVILRYRKVTAKGKELFQLVLNKTPFYAESGGQVGDTGKLISEDGKTSIDIVDTKKENNLIIHITTQLPQHLNGIFKAMVDGTKRSAISKNHSVTHLMHSALRAVLGKHIAQKGSLVNEQLTRFDFSHFAKVTDEEIGKIEDIVNKKIRENIKLIEKRNVPIKEAIDEGATALFGEKYGDFVRVITFDKDFSVELCGGTHISQTSEIGLFKITAESSVAAGVRRVEAITSQNAVNYYSQQEAQLIAIKKLINNPKDIIKGISTILAENETLKKSVAEMNLKKAQQIKTELMQKIRQVNGMNVIVDRADLSSELLKNISFEIKQQTDNLFMLLASEADGKPFLSLIISENLVSEKGLNASAIIRELAKDIQGGGGGQPFYATAGGTKKDGLNTVLQKAELYVK